MQYVSLFLKHGVAHFAVRIWLDDDAHQSWVVQWHTECANLGLKWSQQHGLKWSQQHGGVVDGHVRQCCRSDLASIAEWGNHHDNTGCW